MSIPADRESLKVMMAQQVRHVDTLEKIPEALAEVLFGGRVTDADRVVEEALGETCVRMDPENLGSQLLSDSMWIDVWERVAERDDWFDEFLGCVIKELEKRGIAFMEGTGAA